MKATSVNFNYNFKDLAKFVEDITFLLARGGNGGAIRQAVSEDGILTKVFRLIKQLLLIVLWLIIFYVIYYTIFKGYSRFLLDLVRFQFYKKVDVKQSVATQNGPLFSSIISMSDNDAVYAIDFLESNGYDLTDEDCLASDCDNIFKYFISIVDDYYEPQYGTNKIEYALMDYYSYTYEFLEYLQTDASSKKEKLSNVPRQSALQILRTFYNDVILNYMNFYGKLFEKDVLLNCNTFYATEESQKADEKKMKLEKAIAKKDFENLKDMWDIKVVNTKYNFAKYFTHPNSLGSVCNNVKLDNIYKVTLDTLNKGTEDSYVNLTNMIKHLENEIKLYNEVAKKPLMNASAQDCKNWTSMREPFVTNQMKLVNNDGTTNISSYNEYKSKVQSLCDRSTIMEMRKQALQEKIKKQVRLMQVKKEAFDAAIKEFKQKLANSIAKTMQTRKKKDGKLNKAMNVANQNDNLKQIVYYSGDDQLSPDLSFEEDQQYRVYVPCYNVYQKYYEINKKDYAEFKKDMEEEEVVAFLFLEDIADMAKGNDTNSDNPSKVGSATSKIDRILKLYFCVEFMSDSINKIVKDNNSPIKPLEYITIPNDETLSNSVNEIVLRRDMVNYFNTDIKQIMNTNFKYQYSNYLLEILFASTTTSHAGLYNSLSYHLSNLMDLQDVNFYITFLNLPKNIQEDKITNGEHLIQKRYNINANALQFIQSFPIFSMVFLNELSTARIIQEALTKQKQTYLHLNDITKVMNGLDVQNLSIAQDVQAFILENMTNEKYIPNMYTKILSTSVKILGDANIYELQNPLNLTYDRLYAVVKDYESQVFRLKKSCLSLNMIYLYLETYNKNVMEKDSKMRTKTSRPGFSSLYADQHISHEVTSYFKRLFEPFKREFIVNRLGSAWKREWNKLKHINDSQGYFAEFEAFWILYLGSIFDRMIKNYWKQFKNYTKPRWG